MSPEQNELFFNIFAASTLKTFRDFCKIQADLEEPFLKGEREQTSCALAGIIGLTSTAANGSIVLTFPKNVFLTVMKNLCGETGTEISQENEDAAAELLNIIFGKSKALLNKRGFSVHMAIPSLLRGNQINSSYAKVHKVRVIPFKTEVGEFYLEFLFNQNSEKHADLPPPQIGDPHSAAVKAIFFKPFIDGVVKTMSIQCRLECKPGKPFSRKSNHDYTFDFAGIIGITSKTVNGSFILSFKKDFFLKLISRMFNETITEFQPGLEDAVSELANIILGSAKTVLNSQGHGVKMAIPTVIYGDIIASSFQFKRPAVVIPFDSEFGQFYAEINFSSESDADAIPTKVEATS